MTVEVWQEFGSRFCLASGSPIILREGTDRVSGHRDTQYNIYPSSVNH
uniref:Uncharacterized protein n=1 Tax=Anguilla anguilla TaxID=7936 RepID=A0A0E9TPZ0_ANGAN